MADYQMIWSYRMLDSLGVQTTHDIFVKAADTKTLADLVTAAHDYGSELDNVTDAQITDCTIRVTAGIAPTGMKTAPVEDCEVEKTLLGNFSQTGSPYKFGIDVPAIAGALVVNGKVDLTNSDLTNWINWLTTAHTGIQAVSKFTLILVDLVDALISFRKHRKAESRRSISVNT